MWYLTRHWVACSLNPGVGGIFLSLAHFLFHLQYWRAISMSKSTYFSSKAAAALVAVRSSCWTL